MAWWHFQWPWRTPNPVFKVTAFLKSNISKTKGQSFYRTLIGNHREDKIPPRLASPQRCVCPPTSPASFQKTTVVGLDHFWYKNDVARSLGLGNHGQKGTCIRPDCPATGLRITPPHMVIAEPLPYEHRVVCSLSAEVVPDLFRQVPTLWAAEDGPS